MKKTDRAWHSIHGIAIEYPPGFNWYANVKKIEISEDGFSCGVLYTISQKLLEFPSFEELFGALQEPIKIERDFAFVVDGGEMRGGAAFDLIANFIGGQPWRKQINLFKEFVKDEIARHE